MKKSKQKTTTVIVIMFAVVIAIVIGFWAILEQGRNKVEEDKMIHSKNEEVNTLLNKDLNIDYPSTPREVLKMYSRLQSCVYNQDLSDKDLSAIVGQMRMLFDDELVAANSLEQQLEDLKKEIKEYQKAKRTISNYVIDKESSTTEKKLEGKEYATLEVSYLIQENRGYNKTYEQFILRKDEKDKWKILGWELVRSEDEKQE
ncbi:MAG: hypothetical protein K2N51_03055 [Lachnospiraceae bacterium]|nr:hypothetical protein [Lachnospiraceae bacterium]